MWSMRFRRCMACYAAVSDLVQCGEGIEVVCSFLDVIKLSDFLRQNFDA